MTACWLNRNARQWNGSISPDHTVSDLTGVLEILNIKKSVAFTKEK
jgi:FMN phosphatase YigB (HAD superfamily)